jgi:hypothetical protein
MTVPRRHPDWTSTGAMHAMIRHTCYWMNLEGEPVPPGERTTGSVLTANISDAESLTRLLDCVAEGRSLPK